MGLPLSELLEWIKIVNDEVKRENDELKATQQKK